jgi:hypothetical protein
VHGSIVVANKQLREIYQLDKFGERLRKSAEIATAFVSNPSRDFFIDLAVFGNAN